MPKPISYREPEFSGTGTKKSETFPENVPSLGSIPGFFDVPHERKFSKTDKMNLYRIANDEK